MAAVTRWADQQGIRSIRMAARFGVSQGWPDRLYLIPGGRSMFIEFKAPGQKPTELQQRRIKQLEQAGYDVQVHDTIDGARAALASALDAAKFSTARR